MTVVFASPGFSPSQAAKQPWAYVDRVARGLAEQGFSIRILTDQGAAMDQVEALPYAIERLPHIVGFRSWFRGPTEDLLRGLEDGDILVSFVAWPNIPAWPRSPRDAHQVVALSSPLFQNGEWRNVLGHADTSLGGLHVLLSQLAARVLRPEDFAGFDGVVATSQPVHSLLSRLVGEQPLLHAPSGVDEDVLRYAHEQGRGERRSHPVITYCGPPRHSRGVQVFLEALRILQSDLPGVAGQFLLRPDSVEDEARTRWLMRSLSGLPSPDLISVESTPLARGQFLRSLAHSTICAFPFRYPVSLTPLTLLEAIALGVPTLVTPVGELPQVVGESGLTAKGCGPHEVAAALRDLLARLESGAGMVQPREPRTWAAIASLWASLLDSLT